MASFFRNLRVRTVVAAALWAFVVLFALAGAGGLWMQQLTHERIETLGSAQLAQANALSDTTVALLRARVHLADARGYMEGGQDTERDTALRQAHEQLDLADQRVAMLDGETGPAAGALAAYRAWVAQGLRPWGAAIENWNGIAAQQLEQQQVASGAADFLRAVEGFQAALRAQGAQAVDAAGAAVDLARVAMAAGLALAVALALSCQAFIGRMVLRPLHWAGAHLLRIARGDLSTTLVAGSRNEIGALQDQLNLMQQQLRRMVRTVRDGVTEIDAHTVTMATDNADLAAHTGQQAEALRETAQTVQSLALTVHENAEHAREARERAQSVADAAQACGADVGRLLESIGAIAERSRRIDELVDVMDEISVQTNLLALNAAVEAARAGSEGRGFGVLANEVRRLATQSTQSAAQVRQLVGEARASVNQGARSAEAVRQSMAGVVQGAAATAGSMGALAQGAAQQSHDIGHVNAAIKRIDEATRRNALRVDEAAEAAARLEHQAALLREAIAAFREGGQTSAIDAQPPAAHLPGRAYRLVQSVSLNGTS
ncbi:methyl-accepting chemotaxis protein [Verticiella sediminum]|nr:methyl-accepting chemotaxis protein [Verticiella sediminum]